MHEEAEMGIAAHWHYNDTKMTGAYLGKTVNASQNSINWVNKLATWQKNVQSGAEMAEDRKDRYV